MTPKRGGDAALTGGPAVLDEPQMILIAIGANLPGRDGQSPLQTCRWAAGALDRLPGLRLRGLSRWYRSAPMPPSGQPPYVNGVAHLDGGADPGRLLDALQALERAAERVRGAPNAARTLDLDVIAMDGVVRTAPDPILPHPRAHLRAFVLMPLLDVAPDWRHPVLLRTARELLAALLDQGVQAIR